MDAVAGISHRITQIQTRIAEVSPTADVFDRVLGAAVLGELRPAAPAAGGTTSGLATNAASALGGVATAGPRGAAGQATAVGSGAGLMDTRGVPLELRAYENGRIPSSALSPVAGTTHQLWAPAARSLEALRDAAARDGVTIGITDSYRSFDSQVDVAARKGLYSQGGLAAVPGTSKHGWGVAVDLRLDATAQAWMRENGGRFGFVENVPREPWHWEYRPTA